MARKKKIVANIGIDGTVTPYKKQEYSNIVANISADGTIEDIAPVKTTINKTKKKNSWFDAGAFSDGYDVGDITKSVLGTVGDVSTNFANSFLNMTEGVGDLIGYGIANVVEATGNKNLANNLREEYKKNMYDEWFKPSQDILDDYSFSGEKLDNISRRAGSMAFDYSLGGAAMGLGMGAKGVTTLTSAAAGTSAAGSSMGEAYRNNATNEQAALYGTISGATNSILNLIWRGLGKTVNVAGVDQGVGQIDDKVAILLTKNINNQLAKNFAEMGIKATGEGFKSIARGTIDAVGKKLTYMSEKEIGKLIRDENLLNQFIEGSITSAVMQTPSVAKTFVNKEKLYKYDSEGNKIKDKNGREIYKTKYSLKDKEAVRDYISGLTQNEQKVYDKEVEKRIAAKENEGIKLNNKQRNQIKNQTKADLMNGYISTDTIEEALGEGRYTQYQRLNERKADIEDEINALNKKIRNDLDRSADEGIDNFDELGKFAKEQANDKKRIKELKGQLESVNRSIEKSKEYLGTEVENRTQKDDYLRESYNERSRRHEKFSADLNGYSDKQKTIVQKAIDSGILNNSKKTHDFVNMLAKVSEDKGIDFDFTNNDLIKDTDVLLDKNSFINGFAKDGKVSLNIDSQKSLNALTGHEIGHVFEDSINAEEYTKLKESIKEYAKTKGDYDKVYSKMENLYKNVKGADVESETINELIGDYLFTDKDFINKLSVSDKNAFNKMYDEVKYLSKVATAGSKEKRQLEKVKKTFQDIYNENELNIENTNKVDVTEEQTETVEKVQEVKPIKEEQQEEIKQQNKENTEDEKIFPLKRNRKKPQEDEKVFPLKRKKRTEKTTEVVNEEAENIIPIKKVTEKAKKTTKKMENVAPIQEQTNGEEDPYEDFGNNIEKYMTPEEAKKLGVKDTKYAITENNKNNSNDSGIFSKQVDEVVNGTFDRANHLTVLEHTPEVLKGLGVKDNPITLTSNKLDRIMNSSGRQNGEYHNLGIDLVKKLPEAISNPLDIIKSHNNSYVLTTDLSDNSDRQVIASIKINGKGYVDNIQIDSNVMTSAYGRNNYDNWMASHQREGNIVYDIDRGYIKQKKGTDIQGLQLSNEINSTGNNISDSIKNVKSNISTKYDMQKVQKDTKELDNSSFFDEKAPVRKVENNKTDYSLDDNKSSFKQKQLDVINNSNPAPDDNHTWIRSTDDIKTFNEAFFEDGEYSGMDPDFTEDMAQKSINSGKITVYSSYPIEDGTFVSPSKMEASQYAGGDESKLYSKTVNIDDVAWIDGAEGQYAKTNNIKQSRGNDDIAPIGNYNVYGDDIRIEQDKAPTKNELGYIPKDPTREDSYDFDDSYKKKTDPVDEILRTELRRKDEERQAKIEAKKNKQTTIEKSGLRKATDRLKRMFVNSNVEIDNLAKESGNDKIKYAGDMLNNVYAETQNDINNAQTDNNGVAIGKSIKQLFKDAKSQGLDEAFNDYLIHYSNIDRHKFEKGSVVPLETSKQVVKDYENIYPQFKEWGKDVWNYGKNVKNNLLDAGVITQETSDRLTELYPHYVPYMEDRDLSQYIDDVGEVKPVSTIKRGKGGAENLLPVEEALTRYTYSQKKAVRQNQLYSEIVNTLYDDKNPINFTLDDSDYKNVQGNLYRDEKGNYLTAFVDGKEKSARISDDLYNTLNRDMENQVKNMEQDLGIITKPLQKASKIRRNILTSWNPTFIVKNAVKDVQDASFNSKYSKDFLKNYPTAFKELTDSKNQLASQFKALYGSGNLMGEYDTDSGLYTGTNSKNSGFLKGISKANDIVELAPRYAEFKSSIENGASVQEAMYNAREVTTNFSRGGVITKAMNRNGFTFLNANVQGLDKFIRNFSGENGAKGVANSLVKATVFGVAPAVFNELAFNNDGKKDEDYEALPDYIKDNYYVIKAGDGSFYRIPKGRALSVFGSAARRTLEYANGDENAFDGYLQNVNSQIGVSNPEENNLFAPIMQAYGSENGKAWYGGDLLPTRLQNKPKTEQYDETTDEFSKWLGEKLNASPYKINYLIDQYSGGVGDIVLPTITKEASSDNDSVLGTALAPIKDQIVVNSTTDNKYVSEFYDTNDKLNVKANSYNATDDDLLKKQYMSSMSSELSKLYAERREVQNDETMSRSERYKKSQNIKNEINRISKEALDSYNKLERLENYATIGEKEYYKGTDGKWKSIKDKEADYLNSLGLTTNEKNSYFSTTNNISEVKTNYKDLIANATDEQKEYLNYQRKSNIINSIKNSGLTNEAKAYLYDKNYGDTDTIRALSDLDVNMDQYLDLESQYFTNDKYTNGKTVPNSKKRKVFNYINSMNIPFEQKIILAKLKYNSYDDYNYEIIQYLNKSNLDYDTEMLLLKKMGFKVTADGKVSWK